jgi:hypothetical protein
MTKTLTIDNETHKIVVDKQKEIKEKYKIHINLNDIMCVAIRKGINNDIEKEFGISNKADV